MLLLTVSNSLNVLQGGFDLIMSAYFGKASIFSLSLLAWIESFILPFKFIFNFWPWKKRQGIVNQDKLTHKSDFLLATLRVYMFSPLAKWVGVVSFLYLLYTVTRFDSHRVKQFKGKKIEIIQLNQWWRIKIKILSILHI